MKRFVRGKRYKLPPHEAFTGRAAASAEFLTRLRTYDPALELIEIPSKFGPPKVKGFRVLGFGGVPGDDELIYEFTVPEKYLPLTVNFVTFLQEHDSYRKGDKKQVMHDFTVGQQQKRDQFQTKLTMDFRENLNKDARRIWSNPKTIEMKTIKPPNRRKLLLPITYEK